MSKKYLKNLVFVLIAVVSLNYYVLACEAAGTRDDLKNQLNNAAAPGWGGPPGAGNNLPGIIQTAISAFLGLLGIIFLVLIIYAGFEWMTAQGDEEKVTKAKDTLTRAVIGLVIIIAAYSITYFVFSSLPSGDGSGANGSVVGGSPKL